MRKIYSLPTSFPTLESGLGVGNSSGNYRRNRRHIMLNEPGEIFPNWLLEQVKTRPQGLAVVAGAESLSFEELYRRVMALAGKLQASGLEKGSRVAVLLGNSQE